MGVMGLYHRQVGVLPGGLARCLRGHEALEAPEEGN